MAAVFPNRAFSAPPYSYLLVTAPTLAMAKLHRHRDVREGAGDKIERIQGRGGLGIVVDLGEEARPGREGDS